MTDVATHSKAAFDSKTGGTSCTKGGGQARTMTNLKFIAYTYVISYHNLLCCRFYSIMY